MIPWLDPNQAPFFPDTSLALNEPNGLLAGGGALSVDWLLAAYSHGIFPWFSDNEPILWWTPAPRTILLPENFHLSKSLRKLIRQQSYRITQNLAFPSVIRHCAETREDQAGTWIVDPMINAYLAMHWAGYAHSIECWDADDQLVGGLYGISLGNVFFGESMFSRVSNASKLCLHHLIHSGSYALIDCQMATSHLMSLGAIEVDRGQFEAMLSRFV
ncbi:MAG: leucyl/phenylalanyl-tRNA--protein transferase [Gammaproteobacteria bacterium]|jgi:leucyl/phenylalanyl-tRNA--protein transferase